MRSKLLLGQALPCPMAILWTGSEGDYFWRETRTIAGLSKRSLKV
jgi:hypothetical protein